MNTPPGQHGGGFALGGAPLFKRGFAPAGRRMDLRAWAVRSPAKRPILRFAPRLPTGGQFRWADCSHGRGQPAKPRQLYGASLICCCLAETCWIMSGIGARLRARPRPVRAGQSCCAVSVFPRRRTFNCPRPGLSRRHAPTRRPCPPPCAKDRPPFVLLDEPFSALDGRDNAPRYAGPCGAGFWRAPPSCWSPRRRRGARPGPSDRRCCRRKGRQVWPPRPQSPPRRHDAPDTIASQSRLLAQSGAAAA